MCVIGWIAVSLQENVYEASARFHINLASDLRSILGDQIIESGLDSELLFVQQAILGSKQLEDVVRKTGLADDIESEDDMILLLSAVRRNIEVLDLTDRRRNNSRTQTDATFEITYKHTNRAKAEEVVGSMLDTFIESSLGGKVASSAEAERFLMGQIEEYEERLAASEAKLAAFNQKNYDRLPSMQGGYFASLQTANNEMDAAAQSLRLAELRLDQIEQQIRGETPTQSGSSDPNSLESRILETERQLDDLLLRYTEDHPDVIALRETLRNIRQRRQDNLDEIAASGGRAPVSSNPVYQALLISRNEAEEAVAIQRAELVDRKSRVDRLRGLINELPEVEAELVRLNRDYEVTSSQYDSLLASLERERLSRNVFQSEKIDFRIIDPPSASLEPVAPKRSLLLFIVLVAGGATAIGTAYLLSQIRPIFLSAKMLQEAVDVPYLGTVSYVGQRTQVLSVVYPFACLGLLALVFAGVFLFEVFGPGLRSYL